MKGYPSWINGYRSGWTLREIGAMFGVARETVRKFLVFHGVTIRPRGDRLGEKSSHWKGGKGTINGRGSVVVRRKGRNYYISRLIMERTIGRPLRPEEVVHHINKNTEDNRKKNLLLFPSQSTHMKKHWALRRATNEQNAEG